MIVNTGASASVFFAKKSEYIMIDMNVFSANQGLAACVLNVGTLIENPNCDLDTPEQVGNYIRILENAISETENALNYQWPDRKLVELASIYVLQGRMVIENLQQ